MLSQGSGHAQCVPSNSLRAATYLRAQDSSVGSTRRDRAAACRMWVAPSPSGSVSQTAPRCFSTGDVVFREKGLGEVRLLHVGSSRIASLAQSWTQGRWCVGSPLARSAAPDAQVNEQQPPRRVPARMSCSGRASVVQACPRRGHPFVQARSITPANAGPRFSVLSCSAWAQPRQCRRTARTA